jgi:hypothetical protein
MSTFEIEAILEMQLFHQRGKSIEKYLVKWKGYPLSEATW